MEEMEIVVGNFPGWCHQWELGSYMEFSRQSEWCRYVADGNQGCNFPSSRTGTEKTPSITTITTITTTFSSSSQCLITTYHDTFSLPSRPE